MNQRSNQPDGEPPPQQAKKKAKKSDDAPREMPLVPTRGDPADYRLCAVELLGLGGLLTTRRKR
jgi:hypothetical protein